MPCAKYIRNQYDDFITDSAFSADSHITYNRMQLKDYRVSIRYFKPNFYVNVECVFEYVNYRDDFRFVEKLVDECETIFKNFQVKSKLFKFDKLNFSIKLSFSQSYF